MRSSAAIPLALLLLAPASRIGAQIYYAPVSYEVSGSSPTSAEAKYNLDGGKVQVEVSSGGVRAAKGSDLPYLQVQLQVKNRSPEVASIDPGRQTVVADAWGELSPESAVVRGAQVQGAVQVQPGKSADVDLAYSLGHVANTAEADRFTLKWVVALPGSDLSGETLFRQVQPQYRYADYGWGPWRPWGWGWRPFFFRPAGPFFFDPVFDCDPFFCGRPVFFRDRLIFRDQDDRRFLDRDDLRAPGRGIVQPVTPPQPAAVPQPAPSTGVVQPRPAPTVIPGPGARQSAAPWPVLQPQVPHASPQSPLERVTPRGFPVGSARGTAGFPRGAAPGSQHRG